MTGYEIIENSGLIDIIVLEIGIHSTPVVKLRCMYIASRQNPTVKLVAKLKLRKNRDKTRKMLVEGYYPILFAKENKHKIDQLFICPELFNPKFDNASLIRTIEQTGATVIEVPDMVFDKIGCSDNPTGLLAVVPQTRRYLRDYNPVVNGLYVAVESIEQPHNLGAIIRLADNVGADGVLVCNMRVDLHDTETIRSSFGTVFCVDTLLCSTLEAIKWCKDNKIKIFATSPGGSINYTEANLTGSSIIVMGAEHGGLANNWLINADVKIKIPMHGQANSLSVSASAAIVLYEALRQRSVVSS